MRSFLNINLNKIKINLEEIKKINNKTIIAVIKSNAYGFGLLEIAKFLEKENISYFAVATLEEGITLRKNNIKANILVLEKSNSFLSYHKFNLIYCLYDVEDLISIIDSKLPLRIHIKCNTGLNRLGIEESDVDTVITLIQKSNLRIEGIYTHIANENTYRKQLSSFEFFAKKFSFLPNLIIHLDSSRFINKNKFSNAIRIGLSLFFFKEQTISLHSPIYKIKAVCKGESIGYNQETVPAKGYVLTIPLGYADGWNSFRRTIGYIDGHKIQQIGRTCMDHMMFFSEQKIKSPTIEIIGENIKLDYLSNIFNESKYVIVTSLSPRITRNYLK